VSELVTQLLLQMGVGVDGVSGPDAIGAPVDSNAELQRALLRQLSSKNGGANQDVLRTLQGSQPSVAYVCTLCECVY
jgi:hypothetical protein